jgi:hypothetical protein
MASWPLARAEGVVITLERPPSYRLVKEAHGPTASDLVIETLDGRIPGLLAKVSQAGLHVDPPSGVRIMAAISFRDADDPVVYSGEWIDSPQARTKLGLPMSILTAEGELGPALFRHLRVVLATDCDAFILSDAGQADLSGVASGLLSEQLLLRVEILGLTNLPPMLAPGAPFTVVMALGTASRRTPPLMAGEGRATCREELTFSLTSDMGRDMPALGVRIHDAFETLASSGSLDLRTLEPLQECPCDLALHPCGTAHLVVELTALMEPLRHDPTDGLATNATAGGSPHVPRPLVLQPVRHSGYLLKMQKKKFGLYHRRWFDLYDTALQYSKSAKDPNPVKRLDVSHAAVCPTPPAAAGAGTIIVIDFGTHKLTLKSDEEDMRQWVHAIQQAKEQAELRRHQLETKVKSILKRRPHRLPSDNPTTPTTSGSSKSVTIVTPTESPKLLK